MQCELIWIYSGLQICNAEIETTSGPTCPVERSVEAAVEVAQGLSGVAGGVGRREWLLERPTASDRQPAGLDPRE